MIVEVTPAGVRLLNPDDTKRLHVEVTGGLDGGQLAQALQAAQLGTVDGGHAFLRPAGLRGLAGDAATPAWEAELASMVDYATSKGWVDGNGCLQAHLEFDDGKAHG
ncbi:MULTISPECIES: hypothetical protein [unclassified Arthrobacter]|uniref:hypothetical protein n=1 Tax=unclassified Arthrobacter TaxID=235627 RepID=UPI00159D09DD|nr:MULTISPECIES: hypothetical protein [unclassified Arthrobacter]MCQ9164537.1 hypothetical protein [Arthrobacter sp. STN4]NVM98220.1 hypothetical protein [Arthrobacter sp. SDTb3-6]